MRKKTPQSLFLASYLKQKSISHSSTSFLLTSFWHLNLPLGLILKDHETHETPTLGPRCKGNISQETMYQGHALVDPKQPTAWPTC